jgi:hypothetical protein
MFKDKRILIATDCQSILKAFEIGPLHRYKYLGIETSSLWEKVNWILEFCKEMIFHYIPSHVGLTGNELADSIAKRAAQTYTTQEQGQFCASLSNLKSYLHRTLLSSWNKTKTEELPPGLRQTILNNKISKLKTRISSPRPLQTLFSRYRCDRAKSVGRYTR